MWIRRASILFETSSRTVLTRAARLQKNYMPSGRKVFFTDACCLTDESQLRICVPASDVIDGNIGEGVKEILSTLRTRNGENVQTIYDL